MHACVDRRRLRSLRCSAGPWRPSLLYCCLFQVILQPTPTTWAVVIYLSDVPNPSGFLEIGETGEEGAAREAREEINAEIDVGDLLAVYALPHISQM